ncbi:hypothetical protein SAMN04488556_1291 [Halostagnicola kamekurae]|uniref:Uncharacterized protein n=1 Tax=Halostagnicola kamekurae TaxID=619731 RepID=A0A1I6QI74_9EURY|nr:hypothetical protein SAMN04488556_1291 [Halostagnicola kamekurae]
MRNVTARKTQITNLLEILEDIERPQYETVCRECLEPTDSSQFLATPSNPRCLTIEIHESISSPLLAEITGT